MLGVKIVLSVFLELGGIALAITPTLMVFTSGVIMKVLETESTGTTGKVITIPSNSLFSKLEVLENHQKRRKGLCKSLIYFSYFICY